MKRYDVIVVGSGFSGSVIARKLADEMGLSVLILEKRNHIAGNMYDEINDKGIRIQYYGPHTFITDHKWAVEYIQKYGNWKPYDVKAKVEIDDSLYTLPFNFQFIREYYGHTYGDYLIQKLQAAYAGEERVSIYELLDSNDPEIAAFAKMLCEKDYYPYSSKQWGVPMEQMDRSVISRVKFALSEDPRYIQQKYQYIPVDGFTAFFSNLLDSDKIVINKNTDALEYLHFDEKNKKLLFVWEDTVYDCPIIFTGPIDELFGSRFGTLPYRSLNITFKTYEQESFQDVPFVSYPQAEGYTRIVEYKKLTDQPANKDTTISIEFPMEYVAGKNLPYYPVINAENLNLYNKYRKLAEKYSNLFVCGRLGDYKYYNMDAAIERALQVGCEIENYIKMQRIQISCE